MCKLKITLLALVFSAVSALGQETNYPKIVDTFVEDYNTNNYEDFYKYFSISLKEELPINQAKNFFVEMKEKLGNIKNIEFYGLDDNHLALYKTEFENDEVALINLAVNENGELVGLRILNMPEDNNIDTALLDKSYKDIVLESITSLPNKGQIAIAIINDDKVEYLGFEKNREEIKEVENYDKLFSIANFSTVFTSTILANAVDEGKVSLAQDINDLYDFKFKDDIKLKISELANHSAALPMLPKVENSLINDPDKYFISFSRDNLLDYLKNDLALDTLDQKNRQSFSFLGYAVLGEALTRIYDRSYEELVQEIIFDKYGMSNSTINLPKKKKKLIYGIDADKREQKGYNIQALKPATSGFSSVEDLSKFVIAEFNKEDKVLNLTQKPTLIVTPNYWVSSGWKIAFPFVSSTKLYFSRAIDSGYSNYIGFDPEMKKGLIILTNSSTQEALNSLDDLSYKLMMKLLK